MADESVEDRRKRIVELVRERGQVTRDELEQLLGGEVSTATLLRDLDELEHLATVKQLGQGKATVYVPAVAQGSAVEQMIKNPTTKVTTSTSVIADEEPLVEVRVTNPVAYFKRWWQKVIGNEGMTVKFSLEVKPLTAIALVVIVMMLGLGLTTVSAMVKYLPFYSRFQQFITTPDNSTETAMEGRLYREPSGERFFLFTANRNEAVWVRGAKNVDLSEFDNANVILTGAYNDQTNILTVMSVRNLEEVKQPAESELAPKPSPTMEPMVIPTVEPVLDAPSPAIDSTYSGVVEPMM